MGTSTPNYGLYKPAFNEVAYDDEFGTSMDTIDTELKAIRDAMAAYDSVYVTDYGAASFGDATTTTRAIQSAICAAMGGYDRVITAVALVSGTTYRFTVSKVLPTVAQGWQVGNTITIRDMVPVGFNSPSQYTNPPGTWTIAAIATDRLSFDVNIGSNPTAMTSTFGLVCYAPLDYANNQRAWTKIVELGYGDYFINQTLRVRALEGAYMRGDGARTCGLHPAKQMDTVLDIDGVANSLFQGFSYQQGQVLTGCNSSYVGGRIRVSKAAHGLTSGYPDGSGPMTLTAASWAGDTVYFTTARKHGLDYGRYFYVDGVTTAGYNGLWQCQYPITDFQVAAIRVGALVTPAVLGTGTMFTQMFYLVGGNRPLYENDYLIGNVVDANTFETVPVADPDPGNPNTNHLAYIAVDKCQHWHWDNAPRPARSSTNVEFHEIKVFNGSMNRIAFGNGLDNNDQTDEGLFYRCKTDGNLQPGNRTLAQMPKMRYQVGYAFGTTVYGNNLTHSLIACAAAGLIYGSRWDAVGGYITDWASSLLYTVAHVKANGVFVMENLRVENLHRLIETEGSPGHCMVKGAVYTTSSAHWPPDNFVLDGSAALYSVAFVGGTGNNAIIKSTQLQFVDLVMQSDQTMEDMFYVSVDPGPFAGTVVGTGLVRADNRAGHEGAYVESRALFLYTPYSEAAQATDASNGPTMLVTRQSNTAADSAVLGFKRARGNGRMGYGYDSNWSIVQDADVLGAIPFYGGNDFADYGAHKFFRAAVQLEGVIDGTPSGTSMPGAFVVKTTPSGAVVPVERLRVAANGGVQLPEIAAPGTPPANKVTLYVKDLAGVSRLYYKDDAGVEHGPL